MPRIITNFFGGEQSYEVKEGSTIYDFMLAQNPELKNFPLPVIALNGDVPVLRKDWIFPLEAETTIVILAIPAPPLKGGGGSNPSELIGLIAAATVGEFILPGITGALLIVASYRATTSLLSGLFSQPNSAINQDALENEESSPTYSINASTNQARLLQVIPEGFGKMQIVPDVVAQPYTMYMGDNDQYLFQVFGCGRGEYVFHSLAFGESVFWKDGQFVPGAYSDETSLQMISVGTELVRGSFTGAVTVPGGTNLNTLSLALRMPNGFCGYKWDNGWKATEASLRVQVYVRIIDDNGNPKENWRLVSTGEWILNTQSQTTVFHSVSVSEGNRYQVRLLNVSPSIGTISNPDNTSSISGREQVVWDTLSSTENSIQIQIVSPGNPVTLFPDNVESSVAVAGQELIAPNMDGFAVLGPFTACPAGTSTDRIQLDITFPRGLGRYNKKGKLESTTVAWKFEYQQIDDYGNTIGNWMTLNQGSLKLGTLTPQRKTIMCSVPVGRYQVRGQRLTDHNDDGKSLDTLQWEGLRAYLPGTLRYDQTVIAIRIKATNLLSKAASERFTTIQTRKLPIWDKKTRTWSDPIATRNFAPAVAWVAKADWGGRLPDSRIDLEGLWEIDKKIEKLGWTFDTWIDSAFSVLKLVITMCEPFRVFPRISGSVLTFAFDEAGRPIKHLFTPHDIIRGSFIPTWNTFSEDTPDDITVSYLDEDKGYATLEVQATLPDSPSREPKYIQQPMGIVKRKQAHDYATYLAAVNRYRRIGIEFQIEKIGRLLNLGDIVAVIHPRLRHMTSGRVKNWNEEHLVLEVDQQYDIKEHEVVYMTLTDRMGRLWGPVKIDSFENCLIRINRDDFNLLLEQGWSNPFEWITAGYDRQPTVWTLQSGRNVEGRYIIQKISTGDKGKHTITLMNDDQRVYATKLPVPIWEYRVNNTVLAALGMPTYISVSVNEERTATLITWLSVLGATGYIVEVFNGSWITIGDVALNRLEYPGVFGDYIYLRVCAYDSSGKRGPYGEWTGLASVPPVEAE